LSGRFFFFVPCGIFRLGKTRLLSFFFSRLLRSPPFRLSPPVCVPQPLSVRGMVCGLPLFLVPLPSLGANCLSSFCFAQPWSANMTGQVDGRDPSAPTPPGDGRTRHFFSHWAQPCESFLVFFPLLHCPNFFVFHFPLMGPFTFSLRSGFCVSQASFLDPPSFLTFFGFVPASSAENKDFLPPFSGF